MNALAYINEHLLEDWIEHMVPASVCVQYWDTPTDHQDFRQIIAAIDRGGGQTCDIPRILIELDNVGFKIVRK